MFTKDALRKMAAEEAVKYVKNGMVIGLGTGRTASYALKFISDLLHSGRLKDIIGIPSSIKTAKKAHDLGIPLTNLDDHPIIDLTIDGADEIDPQLNLIKGGGGALLREKILAQASKKLVIIADEEKYVPKLGTKWAVPVEVIPFAWKTEMIFLETLGATVKIRLCDDGSIYKTDQDNYILDCRFGPLENPYKIAEKLNSRAGIMEHGLFLDITSEAIIAGQDGIKHLKRS